MSRLALLSIVVLALTVVGPALPWATAEADMPQVTIIHNGHLITVSVAALAVHLLHGDTFPNGCPPRNRPPCSGG